jgi:hypothetical protein
MAREIVRTKIDAGLKFTVKDAYARRRLADEWKTKLDAARTVSEIMIVESLSTAV